MAQSPKNQIIGITFIHIECIIGLWMDKLYGLVSRSNCGWQIVNETASLLKLTASEYLKCMDAQAEWGMEQIRCVLFFWFLFFSIFFVTCSLSIIRCEQTRANRKKEHNAETNKKTNSSWQSFHSDENYANWFPSLKWKTSFFSSLPKSRYIVA